MARRRKRGPSKKAQRKGGRAAARSPKSPIGGRGRGRSTSSGRRRSSSRRRKSLGGSGKTINQAIKRPGALRAKKRKGESTTQAARRVKRSGSARSKQQANFFLNVLKPASRGRKKRR